MSETNEGTAGQPVAGTPDVGTRSRVNGWTVVFVATCGVLSLALIVVTLVGPTVVDAWLASKVPPYAQPAIQSDPGKHFEAYARLLTLLLALLSVLGVFFGYFMRRSIQDVEEGVRSTLDRENRIWEQQRNEWRSRFENDLKDIKSAKPDIQQAKSDAETILKDIREEHSKIKTMSDTLVVPAKRSITYSAPSAPV